MFRELTQRKVLCNFVNWAIVLTKLNDSMCGPMNRKGVVCSQCMNGYGPLITSIGYKCVRCPDAWYRVPLFLLFELLSVTLLYIFLGFNSTSTG